MYPAPRDSVQDLLSTDACSKYGVYLLLSHDKVYIRQSSDLAKRLSPHIIGKDRWESTVILTTKDDRLNHADMNYLDSILIDKAFAVDRLDCDNKKKGSPPKVDKLRRLLLGQHLEEPSRLQTHAQRNDQGRFLQLDHAHSQRPRAPRSVPRSASARFKHLACGHKRQIVARLRLFLRRFTHRLFREQEERAMRIPPKLRVKDSRHFSKVLTSTILVSTLYEQ